MKGNQHHIEEMEKELEIKQMIYMEQFLTPSPSSSRHGSTMSQSEEEGEKAPKPGTSSQGDSQERQPDINADHLPHIFQHLTNFYVASKTKGKVTCKICFKEIRYSTISNYNIKCHYQNLHNDELPNLLAALSSGSKRRRHASGESDSLPTHEAKEAPGQYRINLQTQV
ncbi:hypothetical protein Anas_07454 [Armadillidium nasatum]|uniref:BED-type domain-containing protein n=1 Tax=Armadillidium nasatum TaxID=96803 RepID=A0A5N5T0X1_9CRUS|nr:hypothetical protein Anas_07454 [Armadillidium nasatum]